MITNYLALFNDSETLSIQPNDALMYKFRADIRGKLGFNKEAVEDYKQAISIQEQIDSMKPAWGEEEEEEEEEALQQTYTQAAKPAGACTGEAGSSGKRT
ncbi:hypothetical protein QYF61_019038, partial [Mycteria americana]